MKNFVGKNTNNSLKSTFIMLIMFISLVLVFMFSFAILSTNEVKADSINVETWDSSSRIHFTGSASTFHWDSEIDSFNIKIGDEDKYLVSYYYGGDGAGSIFKKNAKSLICIDNYTTTTHYTYAGLIIIESTWVSSTMEHLEGELGIQCGYKININNLDIDLSEINLKMHLSNESEDGADGFNHLSYLPYLDLRIPRIELYNFLGATKYNNMMNGNLSLEAKMENDGKTTKSFTYYLTDFIIEGSLKHENFVTTTPEVNLIDLFDIKNGDPYISYHVGVSTSNISESTLLSSYYQNRNDYGVLRFQDKDELTGYTGISRVSLTSGTNKVCILAYLSDEIIDNDKKTYMCATVTYDTDPPELTVTTSSGTQTTFPNRYYVKPSTTVTLTYTDDALDVYNGSTFLTDKFQYKWCTGLNGSGCGTVSTPTFTTKTTTDVVATLSAPSTPGVHYLYVSQKLTDVNGKSILSDTDVSSNSDYLIFSFSVDNTAPTLNVYANHSTGSGTSTVYYSKPSGKVAVSYADAEGLKNYSSTSYFKYCWSTTNTTSCSSYTYVTGNRTSGNVYGEITAPSTTGTRYLIIYGGDADLAGNYMNNSTNIGGLGSTSSTNRIFKFTIDSTAPTISSFTFKGANAKSNGYTNSGIINLSVSTSATDILNYGLALSYTTYDTTEGYQCSIASAAEGIYTCSVSIFTSKVTLPSQVDISQYEKYFSSMYGTQLYFYLYTTDYAGNRTETIASGVYVNAEPTISNFTITGEGSTTVTDNAVIKATVSSGAGVYSYKVLVETFPGVQETIRTLTLNNTNYTTSINFTMDLSGYLESVGLYNAWLYVYNQSGNVAISEIAFPYKSYVQEFYVVGTGGYKNYVNMTYDDRDFSVKVKISDPNIDVYDVFWADAEEWLIGLGIPDTTINLTMPDYFVESDFENALMFYLELRLTMLNGHRETVPVKFYADSVMPEVSLSAGTTYYSNRTYYGKSDGYVTLNFSDNLGLPYEDYSKFRYGWSSSSTTAPEYYFIADDTRTEKSISEQIQLPRENGTWYLWIEASNMDYAGNRLACSTCSNSTSFTSTSTYARIFKIVVDNIAPTLSLSIGNTNVIDGVYYTKASSVWATVTYTDSVGLYGTGSNSGYFKYGWSSSSTTAPTFSDLVESRTSSRVTSDTSSVTAEGTWYLWLIGTSKDYAGNYAAYHPNDINNNNREDSGYRIFKVVIDRTAPVLSIGTPSPGKITGSGTSTTYYAGSNSYLTISYSDNIGLINYATQTDSAYTDSHIYAYAWTSYWDEDPGVYISAVGSRTSKEVSASIKTPSTAGTYYLLVVGAPTDYALNYMSNSTNARGVGSTSNSHRYFKVVVDVTPPSISNFKIKGPSALTEGYTNSLTNNTVVFSSSDTDIASYTLSVTFYTKTSNAGTSCTTVNASEGVYNCYKNIYSGVTSLSNINITGYVEYSNGADATFTLYVYDQLGHVSTSTTKVTYDTVLPTVSITESSGGTLKANSSAYIKISDTNLYTSNPSYYYYYSTAALTDTQITNLINGGLLLSGVNNTATRMAFQSTVASNTYYITVLATGNNPKDKAGNIMKSSSSATTSKVVNGYYVYSHSITVSGGTSVTGGVTKNTVDSVGNNIVSTPVVNNQLYLVLNFASTPNNCNLTSIIARDFNLSIDKLYTSQAITSCGENYIADALISYSSTYELVKIVVINDGPVASGSGSGGTSITLNQGEELSNLGMAFVSKDGSDLTIDTLVTLDGVKVKGIDTNVPGVYNIRQIARDEKGRSNTITKEVIVLDNKEVKETIIETKEIEEVPTVEAMNLEVKNEVNSNVIESRRIISEEINQVEMRLEKKEKIRGYKKKKQIKKNKKEQFNFKLFSKYFFKIYDG